MCVISFPHLHTYNLHVLLTDVNIMQIYAESEPFEIKPLGAAFPTTTAAASATGSGPATGADASATKSGAASPLKNSVGWGLTAAAALLGFITA
jgi:hypothetical protein